MIRPKDRRRAAELDRILSGMTSLRGISTAARKGAYIEQLLESEHRIRYVQVIRERPLSQLTKDPTSVGFDPLKAAILHFRDGDVDEAFWLVFLSTHFGRPWPGGWRLTRKIYGALGGDRWWTWRNLSNDPAGFEVWLRTNISEFSDCKFGNHRKYETLGPNKSRGTAKVLERYIDWVGKNRGHALKFVEITNGAASAEERFDKLYDELDAIPSFGRIGKFDFLTMVGKLGLLDIRPGTPYLVGATGPLRGARLMFDNDAMSSTPAKDLEPKVMEMGRRLGVGMQEMEDSLCNWQKSPTKFIAFRG